MIALAAYAKDYVDEDSLPHYFKIVSGFPMTRSGKVQKYKLTEMAEEEYLSGDGEKGEKDQMKRVIRSDRAPRALGPYSQAVRAGDYLFTSGQVPVDPATGKMVEGGIREQARQVMENLGAVLQAAGADAVDLVQGVRRDRLGDFHGSPFERRLFEISHGAVPYHGAGLGDHVHVLVEAGDAAGAAALDADHVALACEGVGHDLARPPAVRGALAVLGLGVPLGNDGPTPIHQMDEDCVIANRLSPGLPSQVERHPFGPGRIYLRGKHHLFAIGGGR